MDAAYYRLNGNGYVPNTESSAWSFCFLGRKGGFLVATVALLGLSAHLTKNALVPAEPVLESMGLSPFAYSLIWAEPTTSGIVFSPLWGLVFSMKPGIALAFAPAGALLGQAIMIWGLMVPLNSSIGREIALVVGYLVLCVSRAGVEVVQHSVLAHLLPQCLTTAFVVLVFATHSTYVLCNLLVPLIVGSDAKDSGVHHGFLRVQQALVIPSLVSVVAGCILAFAMRCSEDARNKFKGECSCRWLDASHAILDWKKLTCASGMLLILWGAIAVGVLHAFQSVTNGLLVSFGLSVKEAGALNARNQIVSLGVLACSGLLGNFVRKSRKTVLLMMSVVAFLCSIAMSVETRWKLSTAVWRVALLCLTIIGVLAPTLSLALIPEYVREPAAAYGVLDGLKNLCQFLIVLSIGRLRDAGGFQYAMVVVCAGLFVPVALVLRWIVLSKCAKNLDEEPFEKPLCGAFTEQNAVA